MCTHIDNIYTRLIHTCECSRVLHTSYVTHHTTRSLTRCLCLDCIPIDRKKHLGTAVLEIAPVPPRGTW